MSSGSIVPVSETRAPGFSMDYISEGSMQTPLDRTGLAVATVSANVRKPQNRAKHSYANASVSNPKSCPSDESIASIKNNRKQFMRRQTQMQGDVLSRADPDFSFSKVCHLDIVRLALTVVCINYLFGNLHIAGCKFGIRLAC